MSERLNSAGAWRHEDVAVLVRSNKDADALMRFYTPDVVVFDVAPPVSYTGTERHRQNWQQWFDSVPGPIHFEMDIIDIVADGDIAPLVLANAPMTEDGFFVVPKVIE